LQKHPSGAYLLPDVGIYRSSRSGVDRFRHTSPFRSNQPAELHNPIISSKRNGDVISIGAGADSRFAASDLEGYVKIQLPDALGPVHYFICLSI
jgi:hypothetical protein